MITATQNMILIVFTHHLTYWLYIYIYIYIFFFFFFFFNFFFYIIFQKPTKTFINSRWWWLIVLLKNLWISIIQMNQLLLFLHEQHKTIIISNCIIFCFVKQIYATYPITYYTVVLCCTIVYVLFIIIIIYSLMIMIIHISTYYNSYLIYKFKKKIHRYR
jgi:hypothetical protein